KCTFYDVFYEIKKLKKRRAKNKSLWLFADMPFRADDNAEHLYRYVMKNHLKQNIVFVLRKNSHDYKRLKKEGFKLVDPKSFK
ncbi:TPA: capsular biosynthesis protein, partial [Campylobacter jejuni]|nr:capsular biosynthesis protein [Campylobacter jejuni]